MSQKRGPKSEFVIVWEFRVRPGKRRAFEKAYGPDGDWTRFFRTGKGYIRTELLSDRGTPLRYLTLDFWVSRTDYEHFKKDNRAEYQAIDKKCESLTEKEVEIGQFTPRR
jgi:heme-degrading monooxygenase HmoA